MTDRGEYVTRRFDTFNAFMDRWWPSKWASLGPFTAASYDHWIAKYIMPALENHPLQKISASEVTAIVNQPLDRGAKSLAEHLYRLLRMIFRRAEAMGEIVRSPMVAVEPPRTTERELRTLTPDEWAAVQDHLAHRGEHWWLPALHVAITTGLRRSELAGLRWGDFEPDAGLLHVRRAVHYINHGRNVPIFTEPKTRGSRRAIALDAGTVEVLLAHRRECERIAGMFDRVIGAESYILEQPDGRPRQPASLTAVWRKVAKASGIEGVRFHDLRHSAATLLLANKIPAHVVAQRLGHSRVSTTLSIYAHVLPSQQVEAAERLAEVLGGGTRHRAWGPEMLGR